MKLLHLETRRKFPSNIDFSPLDKLPGKTISLVATIQYLDLIPKIKNYLEKQGKKIIIKQGADYKAQVLGCNSRAIDKNADTILLLADGKFHALNNALQQNKEIYIFNTHKLEKITKQEIQKHKNKTKAKISKFLSYDTIGLISSTKPGQKYPNIIGLKNKIEKLSEGKKAYVFQTDNLNISELENFQDIKIWINTACPGLAMDSEKIVNLVDVKKFI